MRVCLGQKQKKKTEKRRERRGSLTNELGLFLTDDQLRKSRQKRRGGLTEKHNFPSPFFPYSALLRFNSRKKKGVVGQREGGVLDGAERETE